ncbi:hypothetical protein BS78_03G398300 [Paspalum vaginatum]|nr:hypothetical protein BS78_03G398300 [Paspalum vaginatum]
MVAACRPPHSMCGASPPRPNPKTNPTNQERTRPPLATPLPHYPTSCKAHIARRSSDLSLARLAPAATRTPTHTRARGLAVGHRSAAKQPAGPMARPRARGRLLLAVVLAAVLALHHAPPGAAASSISAAPEYPPLPRLPRQHHSALPPALSPDIMPVLPSPAEDGAAAPPSDAEPTIPSSPSPPNPDALEPDSALAPFGSAPAVAAQSPAPAPPRAAAWALTLPLLLLPMWLV